MIHADTKPIKNTRINATHAEPKKPSGLKAPAAIGMTLVRLKALLFYTMQNSFEGKRTATQVNDVLNFEIC